MLSVLKPFLFVCPFYHLFVCPFFFFFVPVFCSCVRVFVFSLVRSVGRLFALSFVRSFFFFVLVCFSLTLLLFGCAFM